MKNLPFIFRRLSTILSIAVLTLTLIAAVTGVLIAFYYQPAAGGAYESLEFLSTQVSFGWLVRSVHDFSGTWVIVLALIQIVVMFLGERFRRSWLVAWISGILLTLVTIALSWTAILLDWTQLGYWRFRIELGTIEAIPVIGAQLREILTGGTVGTVTVEHLYTLHSYVISLGAVLLAIVHLVSLVYQEREIRQEMLAKVAEELGFSEAVTPEV
jgi:cytochrome b6